MLDALYCDSAICLSVCSHLIFKMSRMPHQMSSFTPIPYSLPNYYLCIYTSQPDISSFPEYLLPGEHCTKYTRKKYQSSLKYTAVDAQKRLRPRCLSSSSSCRPIQTLPSNYSNQIFPRFRFIGGLGGPVPLLALRSLSWVPLGPLIAFVARNRPSKPLAHASSACPPSQ